MIDVSIDIRAENLEEAKEMLETIANDVSKGMFSCSCNESLMHLYGGTVFVTDVNDRVN